MNSSSTEKKELQYFKDVFQFIVTSSIDEVLHDCLLQQKQLHYWIYDLPDDQLNTLN